MNKPFRPTVPVIAVGDRVETHFHGFARVLDVRADMLLVRDVCGKQRWIPSWQCYYCPEPEVITRGLHRIQQSWENAWLRRKLGLSPMHGGRNRAG